MPPPKHPAAPLPGAEQPELLRCMRSAHRSMAVLLSISLLSLALLGSDMLWRSRAQDQVSAQWTKVLDLSMPVLWPAGTPQRLGWNSIAGLDPRPAPFIPAPVWDLLSLPAAENALEAPCAD